MTKLEDEVNKILVKLLDDVDVYKLTTREEDAAHAEAKQAILSLIASQGNLDKPEEAPGNASTADALSGAKKIREVWRPLFDKTIHAEEMAYLIRQCMIETEQVIASAEREARVDELNIMKNKLTLYSSYETEFLKINVRIKQLTKGNIDG